MIHENLLHESIKILLFLCRGKIQKYLTQLLNILRFWTIYQLHAGCNKRFRSSRHDVFCKKGVLRNLTKFTWKHLGKETLAQVFSCDFCEISKNTFSYRTPPVAAAGDFLRFSHILFRLVLYFLVVLQHIRVLLLWLVISLSSFKTGFQKSERRYHVSLILQVKK